MIKQQYWVFLLAALLTGCAGNGYQVRVEDRDAGGVVQNKPVTSTTSAGVRVIALPEYSPRPSVEKKTEQQVEIGSAEVIQTAEVDARIATSSVNDRPIEMASYTPPDRLSEESHSPLSPAVKSLLLQAARNEQQGLLQSAQGQLERAQRIAPREPEVFYQLARVKRAQQGYQSAEQFALKASELAVGQSEKLKRIWLLVAEIRWDAGDLVGAQRARLQARRY